MLTAQQTFFNLPARNLNKSKEFFSQIGFALYPEYTSDLAPCLLIRKKTFFMLVTEAFFNSRLTGKKIVAGSHSIESTVALSLDSRAEVDRRLDIAQLRTAAGQE